MAQYLATSYYWKQMSDLCWLDYWRLRPTTPCKKELPKFGSMSSATDVLLYPAPHSNVGFAKNHNDVTKHAAKQNTSLTSQSTLRRGIGGGLTILSINIATGGKMEVPFRTWLVVLHLSCIAYIYLRRASFRQFRVSLLWRHSFSWDEEGSLS